MSDDVIVRKADLVPGRWWRVNDPAGRLWCETSDQDEARSSMRPGDTLQRWFVVPNVGEWRDA